MTTLSERPPTSTLSNSNLFNRRQSNQVHANHLDLGQIDEDDSDQRESPLKAERTKSRNLKNRILDQPENVSVRSEEPVSPQKGAIEMNYFEDDSNFGGSLMIRPQPVQQDKLPSLTTHRIPKLTMPTDDEAQLPQPSHAQTKQQPASSLVAKALPWVGQALGLRARVALAGTVVFIFLFSSAGALYGLYN